MKKMVKYAVIIVGAYLIYTWIRNKNISTPTQSIPNNPVRHTNLALD